MFVAYFQRLCNADMARRKKLKRLPVKKIENIAASVRCGLKASLWLIALIPAMDAYSQVPQHPPKINLAIEAYAFLRGQNSALEKVSRQFPGLQDDVQALRQNADAVFGRSERNIEQYLRKELGDAAFLSLRTHIDSLAQVQLHEPIAEEKYAADFIEETKGRMRLGRGSSVPKGVLPFAYHDAPHQEMADGHTARFSTQGHPKADHDIVAISIPKSWRAEEAQMSQTIQQFTSFHGNGLEKVLLAAYELPKEDSLMLTEKSAAEMIAPHSRLIRTEKVKIDGRQAIMAEIEETLNFRNAEMKIRMLQFMFIHNRKLYCLQGSIGPVAMHYDLDLHLKKYEPFFRLVAAGTDIAD